MKFTDRAEEYCPVCERIVVAVNVDRLDAGLDDVPIFVHDDIPHNITDIMALSWGIQ